jgi:hypothetical protein
MIHEKVKVDVTIIIVIKKPIPYIEMIVPISDIKIIVVNIVVSF